MRYIVGLAGCAKGIGAAEIEGADQISVRIIDCEDDHIALRIGSQPEAARLTIKEAEHISMLLQEAAIRARSRADRAITEKE